MATQEDIEHHYDVDNDFFTLFLDERYRAYSCGVWKNAQTLEQAQTDKLSRLSRFAHVKAGQHVIDVGCGWGGLMQYIHQNYAGVTTHGLTLSTQQAQYVKAMNMPDTSVELCTWQNYKVTGRQFDAIISIGAFEHFATYEEHSKDQQRDIYRQFFDWCLEISTTEAYLGLQTIVINRAPRSLSEVRDTRYILDKVFPGSALPNISDIQASIVDKYEVSAVRCIGLDYARTIAEWDRRMELHKTHIQSRYGQALYEHYKTYFEACIRCFESGYIDLYQASLKRVQPIRILTK
jgi:cyclopropane-fatty-acyl-phospholipid synthase